MKILFIVGPTGTGKTKLALKIAKKFNGDLISADSRQVYTGMEVGTGKDLPVNFKLTTVNLKIKASVFTTNGLTCYSDGKIRIFGYDLVDPDVEFSVADWIRFASPVIQKIWQEEKLPIVVGGTGLYIRALIWDLPEMFIPRNMELRKELYKLNVKDLQMRLEQLNKAKFAMMNRSDQNNPRRLVRAIEIEKAKTSTSDSESLNDRRIIVYQTSDIGIEKIFRADKLLIGLTTEKQTIYQNIERRVKHRLAQGILREIKSLLAKGYDWDLSAFTAMGYDIWKDYFIKSRQLPKSEQKKLKQEIIQKWILSERQYAKRQLIWFKKEPGIIWFDIKNADYEKRILQKIETWYNRH